MRYTAIVYALLVMSGVVLADIANMKFNGNPKLIQVQLSDGSVEDMATISFLENQDLYKKETFVDLQKIEKFYTDANREWLRIERVLKDQLQRENKQAAVAQPTQNGKPVRQPTLQEETKQHAQITGLAGDYHKKVTYPTRAPAVKVQTTIADRAAWNKQCAKLALNRELDPADGIPSPKEVGCGLYSEFATTEKAFKELKEQAWQEFETIMNACIKLQTDQATDVSLWMNSTKSDFSRGQYVQKNILSADDEVILHGDLHGDISSILQTLTYLEGLGQLRPRSFELAKDNAYMIFLGDYVDRGAYGVETMYTIMRLKLANPNRVFLVRGNHEAADMSSTYGFAGEVGLKFSQRAFEAICKFYNYLPAAIFVGCAGNYVQCCHGGIPRSHEYQPVSFINSNKQYDYKVDLSTENGFMWSDFAEGGVGYEVPRRGYASGEKDVVSYLIQNNLKGILRAHQHSPALNFMMEGLMKYKGIFPLWIDKTPSGGTPIDTLLELARNQLSGAYQMGMRRSLVRTFNVSPDSWVGAGLGYDFDTCGIMTVHEDYNKWYMQTVWNQNPRIAALSAAAA